MVSASREKFIETDKAPASVLVGDAFKQQSTASCGWGVSALNGAILFETAGTGANGGVAELVSFMGTNTGVNGTFTNGAIDENSGGSVSSAQSLSGTYNVDADGCGRGTLGIPGHSYVLYMISPGNAVIQETTSGIVANGFLVQPQGGSFTAASLSGSYALSLAGTNAAGPSGASEFFVGQLTADGTGKVASGSVDINNFGATQTGVGEIGTYLPAPVASSTAPPGTLRATMSLTTGNFVMYLVSPVRVYALGTDPTSVAIGSFYKQF
jgi:hypothetical protein